MNHLIYLNNIYLSNNKLLVIMIGILKEQENFQN